MHARLRSSFLSTNGFLLTLGLCLAAISVFLWKSQEAKNLSQLYLRTESTARSYAGETEIRYNSIYNALDRLASREAPRDETDAVEWEKDAAFYIDTFAGINSIAWVDETYRIRRIAPLQEKKSYLNQAIGEIAWDPMDINLWIACNHSMEFDGYILGTIDTEEFVAPVVGEIDNDYMLQLSNEGTTVFISENWDRPHEKYTFGRTITFKNTAVLDLTFVATDKLIGSEIANARKTLVVSLAFSFITIIAVYFAQNYSATAISSTSRYRGLFEASQDGLFLIDLNGRYLDANPAATAMVGYSLAELQQMTIFDLRLQSETQPPDVPSRMWAEGGMQEMFLRHKNGQPIPVDLRASPVKEGEVQKYVLGITRDITERKRAEAALRESEEKHRRVVEHANEAILISQDGVLKFCNPKTLEITGCLPAELALLPFTDLIHPDDREMVSDHQHRRLEGEPIQGVYAFRIINKSGNTRWVEINAVVTEWEGRPATLNFLSDITERTRMEERLRQANKMEAVGLLAGGVAHDFNNMLAGILGYANMLKQEAEPASFTHDAAVSIEKAAERAAGLTAQLLGFARGGKHRDVPVNLHQTIQEVIDLLSHTIDKNITLTQRLQAETSTTKGDPDQMQQVILNLAINARDAMPEGGELTFETGVVTLDEDDCRAQPGTTPGDFLMVSVTDTGCGIAKENQERIFEPFFTTKEMGQGTGMGLATVYGIVRNHNGAIRVYSEVDRGTTFTVYLPLAKGAVAATNTPDAGPIRGTGRILLVDDQDVVLEMASAMLRKLGYEVVTAANGTEAVDTYRSEGGKIDLVIIDMVMPEMGGRECFLEMKQLNADVRAVLSTGYGLDNRAQQIMDEGVLGFVKKPYRMAELAQVVRKVMASAASSGGAPA